MAFPKPLTSLFHSLGMRLIVLGMLVFGVVSGGALLSGERLLRAALDKDLSETVAQTSVILNLAVAPAAADGNLSQLNEFFEELLQDRGQYGLLYLAVGHEDGSLLVHAGIPAPPLPAADSPADFARAAARGVLNIRQPLLLDHNDIGFLQYGLSTRLMVTASESVNRQVLLLLFGVAAGGIGFSLVVGYWVVRRLNTLVEASAAIANGHSQRRVAVTGKDELSRLAWNFNLMADAVAHRIEEIVRLNQDLEQRVQDRTLELTALNATLLATIADLNQARYLLVKSEKLASLGALVAGMAHELNTPIGNALTVASTLLDRTGELQAEAASGLRRSALDDYLESSWTGADLIQRNLQRASELIVSFKHVAVDRASEQRRNFDLAAVIGELLAILGPALTKTPYRVQLEIPEGIILDSYPGPLGQVVMNLVNNAVTHGFCGRDQGTLRIFAEREPGDATLLLCLEDDGVGISQTHLPHIFDPFFTTRLGQGGSGLGLSIVYNLIDGVLGGSIQADSEPGLGTRFSIRLPVRAPEPAEISRSQADA